MHWNVDGDQGSRLQRGHDEALHWLHNSFENDSEVLSICYIFVLSKIGPSSGHSLPRRETIHWRLVLNKIFGFFCQDRSNKENTFFTFLTFNFYPYCLSLYYTSTSSNTKLLCLNNTILNSR